jgi:1-deoxy-D-xylulose-5-phosphate reductoisomerase
LDNVKKQIAILGSTGSIGTQALDVIRSNRDHLMVEVLTANNNAELLISQSLEFRPNAVVIGNKQLYDKVNDALSGKGIKVFAGHESIASIVEMDSIDLVLTAMVGFSGLKPTISAIEAGKQIALSNKETLVVAGEYITALAQRMGVTIYPVDSEHSAIFQCMMGEFHNKIERIILTASGGPFRGKKRHELASVTCKDALNHPNWDMGAKITIDSATLMNKGLEVIEAKWLFGVNDSQIEVVIHPQSIIHSMVEFEDGSIKAQMGIPDMRIPIQFALSYPNRWKSEYSRYSFADNTMLNFEKPDTDTFRNLAIAYEALRKGGNLPCIINAANEIAVEAFLTERIGFLEISDVIEACMDRIPYISKPGYEDYFVSDIETRKIAIEIIN